MSSVVEATRGHKTQVIDSPITGRQYANRQLAYAPSVGSRAGWSVGSHTDGVLDEVSNELPDGGSDCEFTLLHTDHTLDPHNHQIELNLTQNHCKTLIAHTCYKSMMN
jgi:hypothetical protein